MLALSFICGLNFSPTGRECTVVSISSNTSDPFSPYCLALHWVMGNSHEHRFIFKISSQPVSAMFFFFFSSSYIVQRWSRKLTRKRPVNPIVSSSYFYRCEQCFQCSCHWAPTAYLLEMCSSEVVAWMCLWCQVGFTKSNQKAFDINQSPVSMPHGKLQVIEVQICPHLPCWGFIWSLLQKIQQSCQISIKICSYSLQPLSSAPLRTKTLWSPLIL